MASNTPWITPLPSPFIYITPGREGQIVLNVNSTHADLETQAKRMNGKGIPTAGAFLELYYPAAYELDIIQTERGGPDEQSAAPERPGAPGSLYPDSHRWM